MKTWEKVALAGVALVIIWYVYTNYIAAPNSVTMGGSSGSYGFSSGGSSTTTNPLIPMPAHTSGTASPPLPATGMPVDANGAVGTAGTLLSPLGMSTYGLSPSDALSPDAINSIAAGKPLNNNYNNPFGGPVVYKGGNPGGVF